VTFAVRTITRSAAGNDIVHRPQRLDVDELVIGRSAESDVCLADLAVSLKHARVREISPGKVLVESFGSEPFSADGRFTTKAELNLADSPRLTFGSHDLVLSTGEEAGVILVDVTRQESPPEAASEKNERHIFSVAYSSFGKRPIAWILAVTAILACLAWPIFGFISNANRTIHADQQWSTGPLSKAHAFLGKNCQACHVKAFVSVRDDTCLSCHRSTANPEAAKLVAANEHNWGGPEKVSLIREHADHDRLLRATPLPNDFVGQVKAVFERQFDHNTDRCASCHLEHLADTPPKAGADARAGHPRAVPVLRETQDCASCHAKLRRSLGSTMLRDTPDWTHHPEFRPLIARTPVGQSRPAFDRISLVQQPTDYSGLIFSHQQHLSKTGGVARMAAGLGFSGPALACADCHRPDKSGKGFQRVEMTRDCASCHSLAFAPGPGGSPRMLPHGHADKVVATLRSYYGEPGGSDLGLGGRQPPGFLAQLGHMFTTPSRSDSSASAVKIRALFAPKGLCSECHTTVAPTDPGSLDFKVRPVNLTDRYLPRGDFNHNIPEHKHDSAGNPNCESCHKASESTAANEVLLPRLSECAACHGKTKEKTPTAASGDCKECHSFHAPGMATPKPQPPAAIAAAAREKTLASTAISPREF
jgi:hypothetical protein